MKDWEKSLRRAPKDDKDRIAEATAKLERHIFPPDTIALKGKYQYRTRIGDWRIKFHYENDILSVDEIRRRHEGSYKD